MTEDCEGGVGTGERLDTVVTALEVAAAVGPEYVEVSETPDLLLGRPVLRNCGVGRITGSWDP